MKNAATNCSINNNTTWIFQDLSERKPKGRDDTGSWKALTDPSAQCSAEDTDLAAVYGVGNTVADLFYSKEGCFLVALILTHYLGTEEDTQIGTILPFLCLCLPQMPPTPIPSCSLHSSPCTLSPLLPLSFIPCFFNLSFIFSQCNYMDRVFSSPRFCILSSTGALCPALCLENHTGVFKQWVKSCFH